MTSAAEVPAQEGLTLGQAMHNAGALQRQGRLAEAEQLYRAVLASVPDDVAALQALGLLYAQAGHPREALALLQQAAGIDSASASLQLAIAEVQKSMGRFDEALAASDRALTLAPEQPNALNLRAATLLDLGRLDEAIAGFDRVLALAPGMAAALYNRGLARQSLGRFESALADYDAALEEAPDLVQALNNRGNVLRLLARGDDALASFDRAVELAPALVEAWNNRAAVLLDLRRHADALASCDRALALSPRLAQAHSNRGGALVELGRFDEALIACNNALDVSPQLVDAHYNRGRALQGLLRHTDALACFERMLALDPQSTNALNGIGVAQLALGRHSDALATLDRALAADPEQVAVLSSRGHALRELGRIEEALAGWDRALTLRPGVAQLHHDRGSALLTMNQPGAALDAYDAALAIQPDFVSALHNRAAALSRLMRFEEALATSDRLIAVRPDYAEAHHNRGSALSALNYYEDAAAAYSRALALKPDFVESLQNRGSVLAYLARYDEAAADFELALALSPGLAFTQGMFVYARLSACDWRDLDRHIDELAEAIRAGGRVSEPLPAVLATDAPDVQHACARTWVADKAPAAATPLYAGERYDHARIRVAYLSADLHAHATSYLMAGLFEQHDRSRFETFGISFGPDAPSLTRTRMRDAFDHFHEVRERSEHEIAQLLRKLEIDIVVDLKGYTYDGRTGILRWRPAPVQVNFLGYPGTLGAGYADYIIADEVVIPPGDDAHYTEKIVRLPDSYQVNDAGRRIAEHALTRAEAGLPESGFVFCSFNNNYKIRPAVFDAWTRLLSQVDGSVLWLLEGNGAAVRNLRHEAEARGIAPGRLVFAGRLDLDAHLARHRLADLFLDTLPVNAHTTASDALWAGLPVLTCIGRAFAGRVAASLLGAVGLPELVTTSLADYEATALRLSRDPAALARIRARLAANRLDCPLFDTARYRVNLESAFTTMWERQRAGLAPESFRVSPR